MADRKQTLQGGYGLPETGALSPVVPPPVSHEDGDRVSEVVPVDTAPTPSSADASAAAVLPASNRPRAPTGTQLRPAGAQTQAMEAVNVERVRVQLEEKRARRARRARILLWVRRGILVIAVVAVIVYLLVTRP